MADIAYRAEGTSIVSRSTDWGAIWAGLFTFAAIWSVFGALGIAIFSSAANPNAAQPVTGMGVGLGIWLIILTIIAMYVAGRETGRLAAVASRHDGLIHGMIMFGLSVVAVLVLSLSGGLLFSGAAASTESVHNPYTLHLVAGSGWLAFVALFLGWLAAMFGASSGSAPRATMTTGNVRDIRPAA